MMGLQYLDGHFNEPTFDKSIKIKLILEVDLISFLIYINKNIGRW